MKALFKILIAIIIVSAFNSRLNAESQCLTDAEIVSLKFTKYYEPCSGAGLMFLQFHASEKYGSFDGGTDDADSVSINALNDDSLRYWFFSRIVLEFLRLDRKTKVPTKLYISEARRYSTKVLRSMEELKLNENNFGISQARRLRYDAFLALIARDAKDIPLHDKKYCFVYSDLPTLNVSFIIQSPIYLDCIKEKN